MISIYLGFGRPVLTGTKGYLKRFVQDLTVELFELNLIDRRSGEQVVSGLSPELVLSGLVSSHIVDVYSRISEILLRFF